MKYIKWCMINYIKRGSLWKVGWRGYYSKILNSNESQHKWSIMTITKQQLMDLGYYSTISSIIQRRRIWLLTDCTIWTKFASTRKINPKASLIYGVWSRLDKVSGYQLSHDIWYGYVCNRVCGVSAIDISWSYIELEFDRWMWYYWNCVDMHSERFHARFAVPEIIGSLWFLSYW